MARRALLSVLMSVAVWTVLIVGGGYLRAAVGVDAVFQGFAVLIGVGCVALIIYTCPYWKGGPID